jgi:hypothetical protein
MGIYPDIFYPVPHTDGDIVKNSVNTQDLFLINHRIRWNFFGFLTAISTALILSKQDESGIRRDV